MEKPEKVEVGQRYVHGADPRLRAEVIRVSAGDALLKWSNGCETSWSTGEVKAFLTYLDGPQPSPEVPPAMKSEGGYPAGCLMCGEKCTVQYCCAAHNEVEFWPTFKGYIRDWQIGKRDFPRPTTPLVPLEGKEPPFYGPGIVEMLGDAARQQQDTSWANFYGLSNEDLAKEITPRAPQGKPHDFTDPYLIWNGEPSCVGCGSDPGTPKKWCTPMPGWRLDREQRISDAQRAADDAMASGTHWVQTRKGTQARQPEGRFQSHLIGQGAIGVWSLRSRDGK